MKARLLRNSLKSGHVASDYIRLVTKNKNYSASDVRPVVQLAHAVLESFEDQSRSIPDDPVVPIKNLITVLSESLRRTASMAADDEGRTEGANLYRGCRVRLRGIPERQFVIHEIFWDCGEVRIKEIGRDRLFYLVPWDCLEMAEEKGT
jgi:hypothetical protein